MIVMVVLVKMTAGWRKLRSASNKFCDLHSIGFARFNLRLSIGH